MSVRDARAACALALLLASAGAAAGSFSVSPISVDLAPGVRTASLIVRNQEPAEMVVQVDVVAWSWDGANDVLVPTDELIASPPLFSMVGEGEQLVRVALRRDPDSDRELSYRLLLSEVPQTQEAASTGLRVALRVSLPVFVAPLEPGSPQVSWTLAQGADQHPVLTATNSGAVHTRLMEIVAERAGTNERVLDVSVASYLLPGATRSWPLAVQRVDAVDVLAHTDLDARLSATVRADGGAGSSAN